MWGYGSIGRKTGRRVCTMSGRALNKQEVEYFFSVPKEERDSKWETALVVRLKRYVKQIAGISFRNYTGNNRDILDLEDFESMAYIGLIKAIREYDPSLGSFSNFASYCMQNAMRQSMIEKKGRDEYVIISIKEVGEIPTDGGIYDVLDEACMDGFRTYVFERFKKLLTANEYTTLSKLFVSDDEKKSETDIAVEMGMTRSNVQLLRKRALQKIYRCMSTRAEDWDY